MQQISLILKVPELKKKKTSERAELIKLFLETLKDKNGKPFRPAFIGMKLAHVPTSELYFVYKECQNSKCFGSCFWYMIQGKKNIISEEKFNNLVKK